MAPEPEALTVGVVHGPNLNLLGRREPDLYGAATLEQVDGSLAELARELGVELETFQSNGEGELIDAVHGMRERVQGFVVNAGGYSHTSIALLDAFRAVALPFVEVHLTNIHAREPFRHRTLLSASALGTVSGFGALSYELGLRALVFHLRRGS